MHTPAEIRELRPIGVLAGGALVGSLHDGFDAVGDVPAASARAADGLRAALDDYREPLGASEVFGCGACTAPEVHWG